MYLLTLPSVESFPSQVVVLLPLVRVMVLSQWHQKAFSFLAQLQKSVEVALASLWPFVCLSSVLQMVEVVPVLAGAAAVVVLIYVLHSMKNYKQRSKNKLLFLWVRRATSGECIMYLLSYIYVRCRNNTQKCIAFCLSGLFCNINIIKTSYATL
jgi:hypothetical protein